MRARLLALVLPGVAACASALGIENVEYGADGGDGGAVTARGDAVAPRTSAPAVDFAIDQQAPKDIVVDAANVYWLSVPQGGKPGAIWKLPKHESPGRPAMVIDGVDASAGIVPETIMTADPAVLYWSEGPGVQRRDKAGGEVTGILWQGASDTDGIYVGLAVLAGTAYATGNAHGGQLFWNGINSPSGSQTWIGDLGDVTVVTVDGTDAYVGKKDGILRVPRAGGPPVVFVSGTGAVQAITHDETAVYWLEPTSVRRLDKASAGGEPTDLAARQSAPWGIAVDEADVYWTNAGDGLVQSVPKAGGDPHTFAEGEHGPRGIAVDPAGVFWTSYDDGRIRVVWR